MVYLFVLINLSSFISDEQESGYPLEPFGLDTNIDF